MGLEKYGKKILMVANSTTDYSRDGRFSHSISNDGDTKGHIIVYESLLVKAKEGQI